MSLTVMQVVPALEGGGVERGTLEVAGALVGAGHRSIVVSAGGRLVAPLAKRGSEHISMRIGVKSPLTLRLVPRFRRLLTSERIDVLHVRSRLPAWIAVLAWRGLPARRRPRLVTTVHGAYRVNRYSRIMVAGERVIAVSAYMGAYLAAHFPDVPADRVHVIPRGIDPAAFPYGYRPDAGWKRRWRQDHPELEGRTVVTLPGRITRRKGHEDFIEVLRRVRAERPEVHGLIVGGAHGRRRRYLAELQETATRAGLGAHLSFTGHRDDMREILASSDAVMVLSRRPEAFGRVALEALSLGVPVVAYDHGGTSEILASLFPLGGVPAGDPAAAAGRLVELLDAPFPVSNARPYPLCRTLARTLALYEEVAGTPVR